MKNKNKLKKIKNKNIQKSNDIGQWFYMTNSEDSIRTIYEVVTKYDGVEVEIWESQDVIEVILSEEGSMDIEKIESRFGDEFSDEFMDNHNIKTVFAISFKPDLSDKTKKLMEFLVKEHGGMCCADTEDFMPQIM